MILEYLDQTFISKKSLLFPLNSGVSKKLYGGGGA